MVGRLEKHTIKLILFQKPRVGHLLIYRKHKECPVVQITKYRSSPFAHTIQTAHVLSRKALYSQASRQTYTHCRRNAIEGARATSDTDNNTLYTINTLHDKRTPHATATPPPQDLSKSEEEPRRSHTDKIYNLPGRTTRRL